MDNKRLRRSKTMPSADMEFLSSAAEKQLEDAVKRQFIETMHLTADFEDVSNNINAMGYGIMKTGKMMSDYCSAVSGGYKLEPVKAELREIVEIICDKAAVFTEKKNVALILKRAGKKIFVNIDEEGFAYALLNILLNAFENSIPGGKIKVALSETAKFAKITVCDNGIGMDEETLEHCMEPFFTKNAKKNGMGLGLAVTRHFVSESGGRIKITSEKGKGTEVSLFIPLAKESELSVETDIPKIFGGTFSPVSIMFASATCGKTDEKI